MDTPERDNPEAGGEPTVRRKRRHRSHRSRGTRALRRYWPLIAGGLMIIVLLAAVSTTGKQTPGNLGTDTFGVTFANKSAQTVQRIDAQLWWPDDSVQILYTVRDLAPGEVDVRKIYAPPGVRLKVMVRLADGTTRQAERIISAGTIGVLRINVHDEAKLSLE